MSELAIMISVTELAKRSGVSNRTARRWLVRKGIRPHGHGVLMADLQARWPKVYATLMAALQGPPPCPGCGTPMACECPVC